MNKAFEQAWILLKNEAFGHQITGYQPKVSLQDIYDTGGSTTRYLSNDPSEGDDYGQHHLLAEQRERNAPRSFGTMDPNVASMAQRKKIPLEEVSRAPIEDEPRTAGLFGLYPGYGQSEEPEWAHQKQKYGSVFGDAELFDESPAERQMGYQGDIGMRNVGVRL